MMREVDDLVQLVLDALTKDPLKPVGLEILDHEALPIEKADLPAVCVYLADDQPKDASYCNGNQPREATIAIEIRAIGAVLAGTKTLRKWAIPLVLNLEHLYPDINVDLSGFHPYGEVSDFRMAGAVLEFKFSYLF